MSYFTDCLERVQFVVLTDGIRWCRENLNWDHVVFSTGRSAAVDLAIASLCDHAIITAGSFSWWAGWFANGVTITNRDVSRPGSALSKRIRREDYYKPDWVALSPGDYRRPMFHNHSVRADGTKAPTPNNITIT